LIQRKILTKSLKKAFGTGEAVDLFFTIAHQ